MPVKKSNVVVVMLARQLNPAAQNVKKQVEKQSEGAVEKLIHLLNDVKDSVLGRNSFSRKQIQ